MKRVALVWAAVAAILLVPSLARASAFTFAPSPNDLYDLDHSRAYSWGLDLVLPSGEPITGATLTFYNIRNWDDSPNVLAIDLLDTCPVGVTQYADNEVGGDYFAGFSSGQTHLITYTNLPSTPQNLVYAFTPSDLAALNAYLVDGRVGIGIDPECHFYNDGVGLQMVMPEPGTILLLATGILAAFRRRLGL
jgi:hypothetical protein